MDGTEKKLGVIPHTKNMKGALNSYIISYYVTFPDTVQSKKYILFQLLQSLKWVSELSL